MTLRINNNIASINGQRNLMRNSENVGKSLEKLSSGLRINRASDDAAGLVISEQMRAQITGLKQAVDNAETAVSMIQTAEGALDEVSNLLNLARELVLHAKNEGANDVSQLQADQDELDNVIQSITRIGATAQFGTKKLLDGNLDGIGATTNIEYAKVGNLNENLAAGQLSLTVSPAVREARTLTSGTIDTNAYIFDAVVTGANFGGASLRSGSSMTITISGATIATFTAGTGGADGTQLVSGVESQLAQAGFAAVFDGTGLTIQRDSLNDFSDFTAAITFSRGATVGVAESATTVLESPSGGNQAASQFFTTEGTLSGATTATVVETDTVYRFTISTGGTPQTITVAGVTGAGSATTFSGGSTFGDILDKAEAIIASGTTLTSFSGGVDFSLAQGTGAGQLAVTLTRSDDSQIDDFTFSMSIDHNNTAAAVATTGTATLNTAFYLGTGAGGPAGSASFYSGTTATNTLEASSVLGTGATMRMVIDGQQFLYTGGAGRTISGAETFFQTQIQSLSGQYTDVTVAFDSGTEAFIVRDPTGDDFDFTVAVDQSNGLTINHVGLVTAGTRQEVSLDAASVTGLGSYVSGSPSVFATSLSNNAGQTIETSGVVGTAVGTTATGATLNLVQTYAADSGEATFTLTTGSQDLGFADFEFGVSSSFALTGGIAAVTIDGGTRFQVGANQGQTVKVDISEISGTSLGRAASTRLRHLEDMLSTERSALINIGTFGDGALAVIDQAIDEVTVLRGQMGAFQSNTLESSLNSLRVSVENLTNAESVIRDVNFAEESATFTKNQILVQSSTAMLAQANQLPQNVLQLLGG
jgi:flagellin